MSKAIKASMNQNIYEIKESIKASNVLNHLLPQWTLDILLLFILGIDWMTNTNESPKLFENLIIRNIRNLGNQKLLD